MKAAIITIGDEILIGQITDTNSVWISRRLSGIGIRVGEMISISDDPEHIKKTLYRYVGSYDLILMTGGLGPTRDDRTKGALAEYFGGRLITNQEVLEQITSFFTSRGRTLIESNRRQADVPDSCQVLMNSQGTAPGMWFEKKGSILVSLPGVPYEMEALLDEQVIPRLQKMVPVPGIVTRTIMTQGVPESYLAALLRNWENELPECISLAYLPRPGLVRLRLTVTGTCAGEANSLLEDNLRKLQEIIPEHIYGYDDLALEEALGILLRDKDMTLSTAESCTGGTIAHLVTSVPGSSDYFRGSVIAYHNHIKISELQVDEQVLEGKGAVCREVVEQMALGIQQRFQTDTAIATSGIAGPGGGSVDKPVGTTWICVRAGEKQFSKVYRFGGNRERIVMQASMTALQLLRRLILNTL